MQNTRPGDLGRAARSSFQASNGSDFYQFRHAACLLPVDSHPFLWATQMPRDCVLLPFFCRCMLSISFWLRNVEFAMAFSFKIQNCLIAFLSDQFEEEQKAGVIKLSKSLGNFE